MGRGWRNRYYATGLPGWVRAGYQAEWGMPPARAYRAPSAEEESAALKLQAKAISDELAAINERIAEIEKGD